MLDDALKLCVPLFLRERSVASVGPGIGVADWDLSRSFLA
jgi:hypothetical protein